MKQRAASPDVLVDLGRLDELRTISVSGASLEIGAMTTLTSLMRSSEVEVTRPILAEVAATVADVQVRNRGTLGGNICVNDPTNHFPPLLVALDASMTVASVDGERTVPAEEFFVGVFETTVREGELLTKITVPAGGKGTGDGMYGVTLGAHGTYIANAAASVVDGAWRIALGCVGAVPVRATSAEQPLTGDVDAFEYRNPHAWVHFMAPDSTGEMRRYGAEWAGPGRLAREGITKDTLKPGDRVVITGSPGRVEGEFKMHLKGIERPADGWSWRGGRNRR